MGDQTDNAFEVPAAGLILNKITGVFAGTGNPWVDAPDAPTGALFLRPDGSDYKRTVFSGSGVEADWVFRPASSGLGGGVSIAGTWRFDTSTSMTAPANSRFRYDNATPASVTQIAIDDDSRQGGDFSNLFNQMKAGDRIYIQQNDTPANFIFVTLTDAPTDNTTWFLLDVEVVDSGSLPGNNEDCAVLFIIDAGGASDFPILKQWGSMSTAPDSKDGAKGVGLLGKITSTADAEATITNADGLSLELATSGMAGNAVIQQGGDVDTVRLDQLPRFTCKFRIDDTTNSRTFCGFSPDANAPAGDNSTGTADVVGLVYSSDRPDTNFQFVANDGVTQTLVDTGIAVDTLPHILEIRTKSTTEVVVTLYDAAGTKQAETTFTTELMLGSDLMSALVTLEAITAVVRKLGFFHMEIVLEGP